MKNLLNIFGKPEKAPVQLGDIEVQVSNLRLDTIARGVNDLYLALSDMGTETPAKTLQNEEAAKVLQGAVQLVRNDERAATVVKAITRSEVVPAPAEANASPNNMPQRTVAESTTQPTAISADSTKETRVTDAQANVATALQNAGQK